MASNNNNTHGEILLWPWTGSDRDSEVRNETHALTGTKSGNPGSDQAVISDSSGPTWPWSGRVFYHPSGPCLTIAAWAC